MILVNSSQNFFKSHLKLVNLTDFSPQVVACMVFGVGDQLRLKQACYPTKTSSDLESVGVMHIFAWFS